MRITEVISPHEYRVERLVSGEEQVVHVSRLKFYHDKSLAQVDKVHDFAASAAEIFEVEKMQDLRYNQETLKHEILIRWRRHSSDYDTWEPLPTLYEDVPTLTSRFLNSLPPSRLLVRARQSLGLALSPGEGGVVPPTNGTGAAAPPQ